ncbi:hypothetical protein JCM33774_00370 [Actinophytocola sp. KF-1]
MSSFAGGGGSAVPLPDGPGAVTDGSESTICPVPIGDPATSFVHAARSSDSAETAAETAPERLAS